jgi:hypothetical protein
MKLSCAALVFLSAFSLLSPFPAVVRAETPFLESRTPLKSGAPASAMPAVRPGPIILAAQEQTLAEQEDGARQQADHWVAIFNGDCADLLSSFPIYDEATAGRGGMKATVESCQRAIALISDLKTAKLALAPDKIKRISELDSHAVRCKSALGEIAPRVDNIVNQRYKALYGSKRACEAKSAPDAEAAAADSAASYRMARDVYAGLAAQVNWDDLKAQGESYRKMGEDIGVQSLAAKRYSDLYAKATDTVNKDLGGYESALRYFVSKRRDLDEKFPRVENAYNRIMSATLPYRSKGWASTTRIYADDKFKLVGQVMNRFPDMNRLRELTFFNNATRSGGGPGAELPDPRYYEALITADARLSDFLKCVGDVQALGRRAHGGVTNAYNDAVSARDCAKKIAAQQPEPTPAAAGTCRSGHAQCRGSNWCCPSQDYCWDRSRMQQAVDRGICYRPR